MIPNDPADEMQDDAAVVELADDENTTVDENEDGSAVIRLENDSQSQRNLEHFANMVQDVDQSQLAGIVTDLLDKIGHDKESRQKRDELYEEGLRRTGLGDDAPGGASFPGATKVVHPMLAKACVDFNARLIKEIMPPSGPARAKVLGVQDQIKVKKAQRKTDFINWQCTEQIRELRSELEQLSTQLPLGGSQYLKLIYNHQKRRTMVEFVSVDDVYLPYAATNFYTAERRTHRLALTEQGFEERVKSGMYAAVDLTMPELPEPTKAEEANNKIEGREQDTYNLDGLRELYEVSTHLDIEEKIGFAPYVIVIDKSMQKAVALYRNWEPDDELREELHSMVDWSFVPWRGAYGIGLTHLIGNLSGAATGALRALLDSAHINNIPGMLKLKGGARGQTINIQPTEVVEIEAPPNVDDIRKIAMPIPFNPPSPVLFSLLGFLVDAGEGVVQTSFEKLSDMNPNAPVGTTLALIEQGMTVYSSIHARAHASMGMFLKILHRYNSAYLTQEDLDRYNTGLDIKPEDFDGVNDVIPVSDPLIFSETQRFAQVQAVQARAAQLPQLYNQRRVEEMFVRSLKLSVDEVLQKEPGHDDVDPVSENVAATLGQPVYVLPRQDHLAHLTVHLAFLTSGVFGSNSAVAKTFFLPMAQHLRDHALNLYLVEAHNAIAELHDQQLTPAQEANLIVKTQLACQAELDQLAQVFKFQDFAALLTQVDQAAQQFKPQPPTPPDSSKEVAQIGAQLQTQAIQQKAQTDAQKLQADQQKAAQELQQKQEADRLKAEQAEKDRQAGVIETQIAEQAADRRAREANESRERISSEDNETALRLAAAEIVSGDKVAYTDGGGINPGT